VLEELGLSGSLVWTFYLCWVNSCELDILCWMNSDALSGSVVKLETFLCIYTFYCAGMLETVSIVLVTTRWFQRYIVCLCGTSIKWFLFGDLHVTCT
jgi:hypothetical protein